MGSQHSHGTGTGSGPVRLALRHYLRELTRQRGLSIPALALPALGNIGITYVAPWSWPNWSAGSPRTVP